MEWKNELFKDKKVRQALTTALDRESIVSQVLDGDGEVAYIPESPLSWNYPKDIDVPKFEYNEKKAKQMLAEAGWKDTNGDGILDKDGKKFSFTLKTNQGNKVREDIAVVVQEQLKKSALKWKPRSLNGALSLNKWILRIGILMQWSWDGVYPHSRINMIFSIQARLKGFELRLV